MEQQGKTALGFVLKLMGMAIGIMGFVIMAFSSTGVGGFVVGLATLMISAGEWVS